MSAEGPEGRVRAPKEPGMDEFSEEASEMGGSAFGNKDRSNPQATEAAGEDDDRHPRFPGRRRNGLCRKGYASFPGC